MGVTLRLDPRLPLVWRTPTSLQLGVEPVRVTLHDVTPGEERMLAALAVGATESGLAMIGAKSGLAPHCITHFLREIEPALAVSAAAAALQPGALSPGTLQPVARGVIVAGTGPTVDRLALRLDEAGFAPRLTGPDPEAAITSKALADATFAVVVGHFVLDPGFHGVWLRRDLPHLPVVFGDTSVRLGPFVEPGHGPCLHCLARHRTDADPAWPAIAAQLWGRRSAAETLFLASDVATAATRLLLDRATTAANSASTVTSIVIDVESGARTIEEHARHPECACGGLAIVSDSAPASEPLSARVRAETERAHSRPADRPADRPSRTTRGAVSSVPA